MSSQIEINSVSFFVFNGEYLTFLYNTYIV